MCSSCIACTVYVHEEPRPNLSFLNHGVWAFDSCSIYRPGLATSHAVFLAAMAGENNCSGCEKCLLRIRFRTVEC